MQGQNFNEQCNVQVVIRVRPLTQAYKADSITESDSKLSKQAVSDRLSFNNFTTISNRLTNVTEL